MVNMNVNYSPMDAANIVENYVLRSGVSVELVDKYYLGQVIVMVFEKYFMRNSSRASLTVVIGEEAGMTKVHAVGSGGGQGTFLSFDWGSADSFANLVSQAFEG